MTSMPQVDEPAPYVPRQARWRWSGVDWNEVGILEVYLPARNMHGALHIKARIEDCDGDMGYWRVEENGITVAQGEISASDPLWHNGRGPQLEAERVIVFGAGEKDKACLSK